MARVYRGRQEASRGTALHAYAQQAISLGVKQADNKTTLSMYINDAIGFFMSPEVVLYYSENCFGTCDSIGFRENVLRISDLKTGIIEADMKQLRIYAALFCYEYAMDPSAITIVLRIYQNDAVVEELADPTDIYWVMDRIKELDRLVTYMREEGQ